MSFRTGLLIAAGRYCSTTAAWMALLLAGATVLATTANATPITVDNFSFELPDVNGNSLASDITPIPGWTAANPPAAGVRDTSGGPSDGNQWAYIGNGNSLYQRPESNTTTFLSNTTYTLTVDVVGNGGAPSSPGYSVAIVDPSDNVLNLGGTGIANDWTSPSSWTTVVVTYSTGPSSPLAGQALRIRLAQTSGIQLFFDNVRLDAVTVPEPTSFSILGLGVVGLLRIARRRSSRRLIDRSAS